MHETTVQAKRKSYCGVCLNTAREVWEAGFVLSVKEVAEIAETSFASLALYFWNLDVTSARLLVSGGSQN